MHHQLLKRILDRLFDRSVMQDNVSSIYIEFMVEELLGEGWKLTSTDWSGWDVTSIAADKLPGALRASVIAPA